MPNYTNVSEAIFESTLGYFNARNPQNPSQQNYMINQLATVLEKFAADIRKETIEIIKNDKDFLSKLS